MQEKRYYWLKFQQDFFKSLRIKRLRKLAGGDTFTIIYLKLQLLSINTEGVLEYKGVFESFEDEMAEEIDEDVENVKVTIQYLLSSGLMVQSGERYLLPYVVENTGSESQSAERQRRFRNNHKEQKALHCNASVTELSQNDNKNITLEKEIEKEIEIDKEKDINNRAKSKRFVPPSLDDVQKYCIERGNSVNAEAFIDFYESKGWMVGKNKMKDWKAAVRTWERSRPTYKPKVNPVENPSDDDYWENLKKELKKGGES